METRLPRVHIFYDITSFRLVSIKSRRIHVNLENAALRIAKTVTVLRFRAFSRDISRCGYPLFIFARTKIHRARNVCATIPYG